MASQFKKTYHFIDASGQMRSVTLYGADEPATDCKFQQICLRQHIAAQAETAPAEDTPMTFREFVTRHYAPGYIAPLAETTQTKNMNYLRYYLYPALAEKPLRSITVPDVQKLRVDLARGTSTRTGKRLGRKTIDDLTALLGKIFNVAAAMRLVQESPVQRVLLSQVGQKVHHHKAMEESELQQCRAMIPTFEDEVERAYAALLFYNAAGMRPEEIRGLRWEDLDLDAGEGRISRAVTYAGSNKHAVIKDTKTESSERLMLLPDALVSIISPMARPAGFIIHGKRDAAGERPIPQASFQRMVHEMQSRMGILGKYCSYDLRSTFATRAIELGQASHQIATLMGHRDSRMVETVYARRRDKAVLDQRAAIEQLCG